MKVISVVSESLKAEFQNQSKEFNDSELLYKIHANIGKYLYDYNFHKTDIVRFLEEEIGLVIYERVLSGFWRKIFREGAFLDQSEIFDTVKNLLKNLEVISLEDAKKSYPKTKNLAMNNYTYHPSSTNKLAPLEHFHGRIARERDYELVYLLGEMGAKQIEIKEISSDTGRGSVNGKVEPADFAEMMGSGKLEFTYGGNGSSSLEIKFGNQSSNKRKIPDNLLESSDWFTNDAELQYIFKNRRSNNLLSYRLQTSYENSFGFNFDFVAKYFKLQSNLKVEYEKLSVQKRIFSVEFYDYSTVKQ